MNKSTHKKHNIVPIRHLKKTQISHRGGGTKYYVDCSAYAANPEVFEIETMLRNTNHIAILKAVLHANEPTIHDKKKVVIKIGRSNAITKNEFVIGEQLYQERLLGFIKYVCLFTCYDDTSERYTEITATGISAPVSGKICGADPSKTNQKYVLVMPYIPLGSVENHQWGESDVSLVKSLVMQVLVSLAVAYRYNWIYSWRHASWKYIVQDDQEYRNPLYFPQSRRYFGPYLGTQNSANGF